MNDCTIHVLARAVIIRENKILLAYDPQIQPEHYYEPGKSFYYLPGGHVAYKESASCAVVREIEEETGYKSIAKRFLGALEFSWSFQGDEICCHTHEINLIFSVDVPELSACTAIPQVEDHVAFQWVPLIDLDSVDLKPEALKSLLPKWLELDMNEAFSCFKSNNL